MDRIKLDEMEYNFWAEHDLAQDYQDYLAAIGYYDDNEGLGFAWEDECDE